MEAQSAVAVMMVRPARFGFNAQTAASNAFQHRPAADAARQDVVCNEFDAVAGALSRAGVRVVTVEDTAEPAKPDAIFPNNWVSFHADGTLVLYPMMAPNRRIERRTEAIQAVLDAVPFRVRRTVDLSYRETQDKFLEGTGSLVLDRSHRIAYACLSPRTDLDVLGEFAQQLDYEVLAFDAVDAAGTPVYHTNVLMAVGSRVAVLCSSALPDAAQRAAVLASLRATGHEVVEISTAQMQNFAGNVLELSGSQGPVLALSESAWTCLHAAQRDALAANATLLPVSIPTIERHGGGGVRCMLAEVHLPPRLS
jgi:hypothetical protein